MMERAGLRDGLLRAAGGAVCAAVLGVWGAAAADPGLVARVEAGELQEARVSWWGYDPEDSTAFLRAAIESGVPRLIVDKMPGPWITDALVCVSDQEIFFEPGVEVVALRGAFKELHAPLISMRGARNVTLRGPGATLRMWRSDYDAPPYAKSEWRHVISLRSTENVRILGLTLAESGGDGIYFGTDKSRKPCTDTIIRDVICDGNYRQGISVISAENLLIENTILRNTAGTPPAAGIDFEPNSDFQILKNIVMRNCVLEGNQGFGYEFYLPNLTASSEPISVYFENCVSRGDRSAVRLATLNSLEGAVKGTIVFKDCRFENSRGHGVVVSRKPAHGAEVRFENCVIENAGGSSISVSQLLGDSAPVGGIEFVDTRVIHNSERPWLSWLRGFYADDTPFSGRLELETGGSTATIDLADWFSANYPSRAGARVRRVRGDLSLARPVNPSAGESVFSRLFVRRTGEYVLHGTAGEEVVMRGVQHRIGKRPAGTKPLIFRDMNGKESGRSPIPGFSEGEIRFTPARDGFYVLSFNAGGNAFALTAANVPVALDSSDEPVHLYVATGDFWVSIPKGSELFAVGFAGQGESETIKGTVFDPGGERVWSMDNITQEERYTAEKGEGDAGGLWRVRLEKATEGVLDDHFIELLGVPGYLFLCKDRYWEF